MKEPPKEGGGHTVENSKEVGAEIRRGFLLMISFATGPYKEAVEVENYEVQLEILPRGVPSDADCDTAGALENRDHSFYLGECSLKT